MKRPTFLMCCAVAAVAGGAIKRLTTPLSSRETPQLAAAQEPAKEDHPPDTPAPAAPAVLTSPPLPAQDEWSIPKTLHPSLRPHRADLDALIAAHAKDKAASDAAVRALQYLIEEDPEAAITCARHQVIREIPGATAAVVRRLQYTDPARAVAFARETNHPEMLPHAILKLAEQNPAAAAHELQTGGLSFPDALEGTGEGPWALLPDPVVSSASGGMRQAAPPEILAFRINALQAVDKLAAARAGK